MVARSQIRNALKRGTQPFYDDEIADLILARISSGESLKAICREPGMPHEATVRDWVRDDRGADPEKGRAGMSTLYARARELGCDSIADEIIELSDAPIFHKGDPDNALVQHARLRCDNRRWLLSKLAPKKYGDKITTEITGEDGGALITRIELVPVAARPRPAIEHDDTVATGPRHGKRKAQKP